MKTRIWADRITEDLFCSMDQGPTSMAEVVHVYNFENIQNKTEIPTLIQAILNGAE